MVRNVLEYLEATCERIPDRVALRDEDGSLTYGEYLAKAKTVATFIARRVTGGERNRPIAVIIDRNIRSIVAFMGIAYSGNFYVPIDNSMPAERVDLIYRTLEPIAVIDAGSQISDPEALSLDEILSGGEVDEELLLRIRSEAIDTDPLYGIFTSGSTGVPKGVVVSHRSVIDMVEAFGDAFGFDGEMVHGNQAPFDFDVSVKDIYNAMRNGGTVVVIPKKLFMLPKLLLEFLNENRINTMIWAVSALRIVSDFKALEAAGQMPDIRYIMFSGEVMPVKALNYWMDHVPAAMYVNLYGPTEITCNCTYYIVDGRQDEWKALPIGKSFANTRVVLLDSERKKLITEPGEVGELCVAGAGLALGYWNDPEKTREAFFDDPTVSGYGSRLYGTGDMAFYDENGDLVFAARKDSQIKHMGHRIELGEIEVALNAIPFVETCCCLFDKKKDKILCFYQSESDDTRTMVKMLGEKLPKYMWPNIFHRFDRLPMNKNSKIDRARLRKEYIED